MRPQNIVSENNSSPTLCWCVPVHFIFLQPHSPSSSVSSGTSLGLTAFPEIIGCEMPWGAAKPGPRIADQPVPGWCFRAKPRACLHHNQFSPPGFLPVPTVCYGRKHPESPHQGGAILVGPVIRFSCQEILWARQLCMWMGERQKGKLTTGLEHFY